MALEIVREHPRYKLGVDTDRQLMYSNVNGVYTEEDAASALKDYYEVISMFKPTEYTMVIDCNDLLAQYDTLVELLRHFFSLYIETGFIAVLIVDPTDIISTMQMKRLVEEIAGDDIFQFIGEFTS